MQKVQDLVRIEDHRGILQLEGKQYNKYKTVAAINLGLFNKALEFVEKGSFENAYILYRLKEFKRALRMLKYRDDKRSDILKSQCFYNMGYYAEAYNLLSRHGYSDEYAVNLAAMESLSYLNEKNRFSASIFATPYRSSIKKTTPPLFKDKECNMEYEYNMAFKMIEDEKQFINELENLNRKWGVPDSCIKKQLNNLNGEIVDNPREKEKEIIRFNSGEKNAISNPVHFQVNFLDSIKTEYSVFKAMQHSKGNASYGSKDKFCDVIPGYACYSDKLKILNVLLHLKRNDSKDNKDNARKILSNCGDCISKDILQAFLDHDGSSASKDHILNLVEKVKNIK